MKTITIRDREITTPTKWEDLSTITYINLMRVFNTSGTISDQEFLIDFICTLSGCDKKFISSLYEREVADFVEIFTDFTKNPFKSKECKKYIIEDRLYSYEKVDELTLGEKVTINILQEHSIDELDNYLDILSILIRPATEFKNETGKISYILEESTDDIELIKWRRNLYKDIPAVNTMKIVESFISGRKK